MDDGEQDAFGQAEYRAYLLRLWRVTAGGQITWRASLESPDTGERLGFANLAALCAFLQGETGRNCGHGAPTMGSGRECGEGF
jgi:hypothetical protein